VHSVYIIVLFLVLSNSKTKANKSRFKLLELPIIEFLKQVRIIGLELLSLWNDLLLDELIVNDVPANIGTLIIIKVEVHVYTEGDLDCLGWVRIIFNLA
jgi:hypothetical protein